MAQKHCRKFHAAELGARTIQTTDRQTTDGRATAYSEPERELAFAKIILGLNVAILAVHSYNTIASTYMELNKSNITHLQEFSSS